MSFERTCEDNAYTAQLFRTSVDFQRDFVHPEKTALDAKEFIEDMEEMGRTGALTSGMGNTGGRSVSSGTSGNQTATSFDPQGNVLKGGSVLDMIKR